MIYFDYIVILIISFMTFTPIKSKLFVKDFLSNLVFIDCVTQAELGNIYKRGCNIPNTT